MLPHWGEFLPRWVSLVTHPGKSHQCDGLRPRILPEDDLKKSGSGLTTWRTATPSVIGMENTAIVETHSLTKRYASTPCTAMP